MPHDDCFPGDFLNGCDEIADYIGQSSRRTFTLLQGGIIPGFKEGDKWRARKSTLRKHYEALETARSK
jgi:hypothetical protein